MVGLTACEPIDLLINLFPINHINSCREEVRRNENQTNDLNRSALFGQQRFECMVLLNRVVKIPCFVSAHGYF